MKPGYKQTEVGVIPEEWDVKTLGQMAALTSSKRIFESDYVPFGIPFYRGKEISMMAPERTKLQPEAAERRLCDSWQSADSHSGLLLAQEPPLAGWQIIRQ
jgi:hypothetical protein